LTGKSGDEERAKKPLLDFASMAQYFTLDSIAKVAFGEEFGLIREERDIYGHIEMLNEIAPATVVIAAVPYFRAVMGSKFVLKLIGPKPGDKRGVGRIMGWVSSAFSASDLVKLTERPAPAGRSWGNGSARMRKSKKTCWCALALPYRELGVEVGCAKLTKDNKTGIVHPPRTHPTAVRDRGAHPDHRRLRHDGHDDPLNDALPPQRANGLLCTAGRDRRGHQERPNLDPRGQRRGQ
jgi:hypothetical protein